MVLFQNIWWLLVLIGVMILIHELGHYWAARFFDVKVETFSFGFGPRLFGFRKGETDFRFSAILFGGYVKMAGEQPGDEHAADPRGFLSKPRWQRMIIAVAGPMMNVALAVALLTGLFMVKFPTLPKDHGPATVGWVAPDSPAAKAGVREGDKIVEADGQRDPTWEDIALKEAAGAQRPLPLIVEREGRHLRLTPTPALNERHGIGEAGWERETEIQVGQVEKGMQAEKAGLRRGDILVKINGQPIRSTHKVIEAISTSNGQPVEIEYAREGRHGAVSVQPTMRADNTGKSRWMIGVWPEHRIVFTRLPFPQALAKSVRENRKYAGLIYWSLKGIIERRMSAKTLEGPIRMAQLSGDAAREGPTAFIGLMAMVSLNLAIFNLLPIPILDGGVILLLLVEMIMRRDLSLQVKEAVFKLGFVFLMAVVVFVLYNDITKIIPAG